MPDPTKRTISATQSPALFGVSSYLTKWMLYQQFIGKATMEIERNERMDWGIKMQPLILDQVAKEQKLEVIPNDRDNYIRRGLLGCTRDATIICPDRGPGALEIKCVFDYNQWATKWDGGKNVPREYEIQLQQQMMVGDGDKLNDERLHYEWGLIAVWVCADLYYFERKPIHDLWEKLEEESKLFFLQCEGHIPPPQPLGHQIEISWLSELMPIQKATTLDLSREYHHIKTSEMVSMYKHHKDNETTGKAAAEPLRSRMLALAGTYSNVLLPCGVSYKLTQSGKSKRISVYVPEHPLPPAPESILAGG